MGPNRDWNGMGFSTESEWKEAFRVAEDVILFHLYDSILSPGSDKAVLKKVAREIAKAVIRSNAVDGDITDLPGVKVEFNKGWDDEGVWKGE